MIKRKHFIIGAVILAILSLAIVYSVDSLDKKVSSTNCSEFGFDSEQRVALKNACV